MSEHAPLYSFGRPLEFKNTDSTSTRAKVLGNFYLTFWHSQGNPNADSRITSLIAYRSCTTWDESAQAELSKLGPLTAADKSELRLPGDHRAPKSNVRGQFDSRWFLMNQQLTDPNFASLFLAKNKSKSLVRDLGRSLIAIDTYYQVKDRRFSTCGDSHESMYRTFILNAKSTGSNELDWIYQEVRTEPLDSDTRWELGGLAVKWERAHNYDAFYNAETPPPVPVAA